MSQNIFEQVFQKASNTIKVKPPQSPAVKKADVENEGRSNLTAYKNVMQSTPDFAKTPMKPLRSMNLRKPPTRVPCTPQAKKIAAVQPPSAPTVGESDMYVYVRIRPLMNNEEPAGNFAVEDKTITAQRAAGEKSFTFTDVIGEGAQQRDVFNSVAMPMLRGCVRDNSDCLLLAYGASGSGKSYTITGTQEEPGLMPRVIKLLLETPPPKGTERGLLVSCAEVYNEKIIDLFGDITRPLRIGRDGFGFTSASGITEFEITTEADIHRTLSDIEAARKKCVAKFNATSSKSHCIFTLKLVTIPLDPRTKKRTNDVRQIKCTKLSIVDLAGSERIAPGAASALTACNINKSMLALSKCIRQMRKTGRGKPGPIPFRESKLTEMLKDFFEPCSNRQAIISIVVNISPSSSQAEDTFNSLTFAGSVAECCMHAGDEDDDDFQIQSIDFDDENGDDDPLDIRLLAQKEAEIRQKAHEEMAEMARKMQDDYQRSIQQLRAQSAEPYTAKIQQALAQRMKREAKSREYAECVRQRDADRARCIELETMINNVEKEIAEKEALLAEQEKRSEVLESNISRLIAGSRAIYDRHLKTKTDLEKKIAEKEAFWKERIQGLLDQITRLRQ